MSTTTGELFPATSQNTYREAARTFWPHHAELIYDGFDTINRLCFANEVPMHGIIVGLIAHGGALGLTRPDGRIILHPSLLTPATRNPWGIPAESCSPALVVDVLTHEMVHAYLFARGLTPDHNDEPWCKEVQRLSPIIGQGSVVAAPWRRSRRSKSEGGGLHYTSTEGALTRKQLKHWPNRPANYYAEHDEPWWEVFHQTARNIGGAA